MKVSKLVNNATVDILLFISEHGPVRHREISKLVKSRGTLSVVLRELLEDELIARYVDVRESPVKTYYVVTEKGKHVAKKFVELKELLSS
ncbi:MAG: hypothetical protein DRJ31_02010 [Candidatus Methanomethylicota archaeon]|uniref:HTH hxlR-type domain-containing protein n=1 Tax=Thermoproteota archaeon TaxID=2056631 RepID=A0A497ESN8_9CREN|nr:MAG: hypothetical protein DRJ31_02010 [Candidatus Verstraetearchaeota archaeon]